jgi:hypothetical protein
VDAILSGRVSLAKRIYYPGRIVDNDAAEALLALEVAGYESHAA